MTAADLHNTVLHAQAAAPNTLALVQLMKLSTTAVASICSPQSYGQLAVIRLHKTKQQ